MKLFGERELSGHLDERRHRIRNEVHALERDYVLSVDEAQYILHLVERSRIDPVVVDWSGMSVSDRVEMIPAERFPNLFTWNVERGHSYPKQVLTYHLPFTGERELLRMRPQQRYNWTTEATLNDGCICFDIVNFYDSPENVQPQSAEKIKQELEKFKQYIDYDVENSTGQVTFYNDRLEPEIRHLFSDRKAALLKQANLVQALGIPLKRATNVPATFAVPFQKRKLVFDKPRSSTVPYVPEPALEQDVYEEILRIAFEFGDAMERHPRTYTGKDEEGLRDYLLLVLSTHFDSATGETFNKAGKTDILVRHEKQNAFVAECKFWSGAKGYHKTIDQLLGYLTWRDSKAAAIVFVRNKELQPVLRAIESVTPGHPCFVEAQGKRRDGWFMYRFRLPEDPSRGLQLAVLVFHLP